MMCVFLQIYANLEEHAMFHRAPQGSDGDLLALKLLESINGLKVLRLQRQRQNERMYAM